eukprot:g44728.t1
MKSVIIFFVEHAVCNELPLFGDVLGKRWKRGAKGQALKKEQFGNYQPYFLVLHWSKNLSQPLQSSNFLQKVMDEGPPSLEDGDSSSSATVYHTARNEGPAAAINALGGSPGGPLIRAAAAPSISRPGLKVVFAKVHFPAPKSAKLELDFNKIKVSDLPKLGLSALDLDAKDFSLHSIASFSVDVLSYASLQSSSGQTLTQVGLADRSCLYFTSRVPPKLKLKKRKVVVEAKASEEGKEGKAEVAAETKETKIDATPENAIEQLSKKKGAERIAILDYIDCQARKTVESKAWLQADESVLVELLSRDTLGIDELTLLDSVLEWQKFKSGRSLAKLKPLIRFGTFTVKEVASKVLPLGILTQAESLALFTYISQAQSGKDVKLAGFPEIATKKRKGAQEDFRWDILTPMEGVTVEEDGALLNSLPYKGQNTTVRTKQGFRQGGGVHTWTIEILEMSSNTSFRAGLVTNGFKNWQ